MVAIIVRKFIFWIVLVGFIVLVSFRFSQIPGYLKEVEFMALLVGIIITGILEFHSTLELKELLAQKAAVREHERQAKRKRDLYDRERESQARSYAQSLKKSARDKQSKKNDGNQNKEIKNSQGGPGTLYNNPGLQALAQSMGMHSTGTQKIGADLSVRPQHASAVGPSTRQKTGQKTGQTTGQATGTADKPDSLEDVLRQWSQNLDKNGGQINLSDLSLSDIMSGVRAMTDAQKENSQSTQPQTGIDPK